MILMPLNRRNQVYTDIFTIMGGFVSGESGNVTTDPSIDEGENAK